MSALLTFLPLSAAEHAILEPHFAAIYDATAALPVAADLEQVEVIYALDPQGLQLADLPALRLIQTPRSGADSFVANSLVREAWATRPAIQAATSSGVHASVIPSYVVAMIITLLQRLDKQIVHARVERTWAKGEDFPMRAGGPNKAIPMRGKTVGMLGYGHLGRETARLLQAFGMNIIAANSSGTATADRGYVEPGSGDREGSIPSQYYSTSDREAFHAFLQKSEILVCSLPSTPKTQWLLGPDEFAQMPSDGILVNIGRGDLFHTADLLDALSHNLGCAALDVTDPEPLPAGHPLFSHPNVLVTHHMAGHAVDEYESTARLLVENVKRVREGKEAYNCIVEGRGY